METRRKVLAAFTSGLVVGGGGVYTGSRATATGYGSIQWANERDEWVWVHTTLRSDGGAFSSPFVAYDSEYRIFPTDHARSGDTNVVETGRYDIEVTVESNERSERTGPFSTTWRPEDCLHQRLIVRVKPDLSVEFSQREC
jgi:hypothetical protein